MNGLPHPDHPSPLPVAFWLVPLLALLALLAGVVLFRDAIVSGFATRLFGTFIC